MKSLKVVCYVFVLCFVSTALPAMEDLPPDIMEEPRFLALPQEFTDIIILNCLLDHLNDCNNIHENLQAVASLYQVSKYFKKYFDEHYPELMFVLHGIDPDSEGYKEKIEKTKKFLTKKNLFIDTRSTRAQTLLHKAAWHSKSKIIKTLLDLAANYKLLDFLNYSAYTIAKRNNCLKIINYLDTNLPHYQIDSLRRKKPLVPNGLYSKALVERKLDVFEQWLNKQTKDSISDKREIYDWLVRTIKSKKRLKQYFDKIKKLGLEIDLEEAIVSACKTNNRAAVDYFFEQNGMLLKDKLGCMLITAAENNSTSIILRLIDGGADVNLTYKDEHLSLSDECTALISAAKNGCLEVAKILIDNGAKINFTTDGFNCTPLIWAAENGCLEVAQLLIDSGASLNLTNIYGATALIMSVIRGQPQVAQLLIGCGADINATSNSKKTALIWAAERGCLKIAQFLIGGGAKIDLTCDSGKTALIWAAGSGHPEVVQLLIKCGADIDATDNDGRIALITAVREGHLEVAQLLIGGGADINLTDKSGRTALMWAKEKEIFDRDKDYSKIIELLSKETSSIEDLTNKIKNLDL